jgi:hypothetical protein
MRVLVCGVIGAVVATAAWLGLEHVLEKDMGWLAIGVGLVAGVCIHKAAGNATGGGYVRGGFAALLALAAIVGGRQVYAKVMESVNEAAAAVPGVAEPVDPADDDSASSSTGGEIDSVADERPERPTPTGGQAGIKPQLKNQFSAIEMVWMCAAALVAYIVGKGPDPIHAEDEEAGEQTGQSSQAPSDSDE